AESDPPSITSTPAIESRSDSREKPSPAKSGSDWPSRSGIIAVLPKRIVSGDLMGRYMRLPSGENLGMQKPAQIDFGGPPATGTAKVAMGPSCTPCFGAKTISHFLSPEIPSSVLIGYGATLVR